MSFKFFKDSYECSNSLSSYMKVRVDMKSANNMSKLFRKHRGSKLAETIIQYHFPVIGRVHIIQQRERHPLLDGYESHSKGPCS